MKIPENSETSLRNRKKKENVPEKSEKSVKNSSKSSEKMKECSEVPDVLNGVKEPVKFEEEIKHKGDTSDQVSSAKRSDENFRIRIEFDPMSIALFTLAIVTRFFKLSEPRNIV